MNPNEIKAVHKWFQGDPHLNGDGELVNRSSLLKICLGLGILLDDACLVLFTEDEHREAFPEYIACSTWDPSDHDQFMEYMHNLQYSLYQDSQKPRCVN